MSRSARSKRTLAFAPPSPSLDELPEAGPAPDDTIPDYPSDATTRVLRTDLIVHGLLKAKRDNSHLLPSVIVEPVQDRTQPMRVIPPAPASHVRPVERRDAPTVAVRVRSAPSLALLASRVRDVPSLALMALLVSAGVLAARVLPVLGRWIESVLGG